MGELRWVGIGLLVVFVDLRLNGVDFVTDSVGWVVAAAGLFSLRRWHTLFGISGAAAVVGFLAWAADPWLGVDQGTASVVEGIAQTVVVFATCTALMDLVPERRSTADLIRWWDLGLGVVALLVGALFAGEEGGGAVLLVLLLVIPALVVYVAFLVLLFRCAPVTPRAATASR